MLAEISPLLECSDEKIWPNIKFDSVLQIILGCKAWLIILSINSDLSSSAKTNLLLWCPSSFSIKARLRFGVEREWRLPLFAHHRGLILHLVQWPLRIYQSHHPQTLSVVWFLLPQVRLSWPPESSSSSRLGLISSWWPWQRYLNHSI